VLQDSKTKKKGTEQGLNYGSPDLSSRKVYHLPNSAHGSIGRVLRWTIKDQARSRGGKRAVYIGLNSNGPKKAPPEPSPLLAPCNTRRSLRRALPWPALRPNQMGHHVLVAFVLGILGRPVSIKKVQILLLLRP